MAKTGIVITCFLCCLGFAVSADYHESDIIVLFNHGVIQMPEGKATATLGELVSLPDTLNGLLLTYDMQTIRKSFPDRDSGDTLSVGPAGNLIKRPDFAKIHRLTFPLQVKS